MIFGLARTTVLGLMERQESAVPSDTQLTDAGEAEPPPAPTTIERRTGWGDRRRMPEE
jgi:hypothetical protein